VVESDGALEDVAVMGGVVGGGIGAIDAEDVAELGEEELVVGALGGLSVGPTRDEGGDGIVGHQERDLGPVIGAEERERAMRRILVLAALTSVGPWLETGVSGMAASEAMRVFERGTGGGEIGRC
jgi:hypothetical protein